jgi:serine/threonine-protein kinase HipA
VARNQDDHVKNIAFLMDRNGNWSLAPAFDMTYSYQPSGDWTSNHQMTVNGKRDNFTMEDFLMCGKSALLKQGQAKNILNDVRQVVSCWSDYAVQAGVKPYWREKIQKTLRLSQFE